MNNAKVDELHNIPNSIHLYDEGSAKTLNIQEIALYLQNKFPETEVDIRDDILRHFHKAENEQLIENLAEQIAGSRVRDITKADSFSEPLYGEIEFEKRGLNNSKSRPFGILYDGFKLSLLLQRFIIQPELSGKHMHIVFTNRLFGTWDPKDKRYHARVSIYSLPCLISTTGIVEAPAKPKEFYMLKQRYGAFGLSDALLIELKQRFQGRFIDHDDERLTEVMKGYVMQAWFYHVSGHPFCKDRDCRLFNAHWQEEVIQAQLKSKSEFCLKHKSVFDHVPSM